MKRVFKPDTIDFKKQTDIKHPEVESELSIGIEEKLKHQQNLYHNENHIILNGSCSHKGPHGSRYHGQRGGGWCYWCYICNPSNPRSY